MRQGKGESDKESGRGDGESHCGDTAFVVRVKFERQPIKEIEW